MENNANIHVPYLYLNCILHHMIVARSMYLDASYTTWLSRAQSMYICIIPCGFLELNVVICVLYHLTVKSSM